MSTRIVTAETEEGRRAIEEVMDHSYQTDLNSVPPAWSRALVVDGVPVSFILIDPDDSVPMPGGRLRSAFISDVATREDRRREGHFRAILEHTFADLRAADISTVVCHGESHLYRRFGFDVYAHHCGLLITPELVARRLGALAQEGWATWMELDDHPHLAADLLLITDSRAETLAQAKAMLQTAAALARERGKERIVFEFPSEPEARVFPSMDSPLVTLALACGGQLTLQGADPEGRPIAHADWIKVLDAPNFLTEVLSLLPSPAGPLPQAAVSFDTDAGMATIRASSAGVEVTAGAAPDAPGATWPSGALAQLALGYASAAVLAEMHNTPLPTQELALLVALFPRQWRVSRNESWVFRQ